MSDIVKIIRVFLASPGDLADERRLVNEAVVEINKQIAPYHGFYVELKGWEDTLSGRGRPQEIINKELDVCELFIGMMWKKWGTPSSKDGPYTSGFEEEYERALKRSEKERTPEMAIYFKRIEPDLLSDPGDDLKKVLTFKSSLIAGKNILFQEFIQPIDLQTLVRQKIIEYILRLSQQKKKHEEDERSQTKNTAAKNEYSEDDVALSLFAAEGHRFLEELLERTKVPNREEIYQVDVARLRLLSNTITVSGNDNPHIGPHDANILFQNRVVPYGDKEISTLLDAGLKGIKHENIPLWHWYRRYYSEVSENCLQFKSLSEDGVAIGALEAMRIIGAALPSDGKNLNRKLFVNHWLREDTTDNIKTFALRYLKYQGKEEDLDNIQKEIDRASFNTSKIALEAKIAIQLRNKKSDALNTIFEQSFETIDTELLSEVLSISLPVEDRLLRLGLEHRNKEVKLESLSRLADSNGLKQDDLIKLYNDTSAQVRKKAVELTILAGKTFSDKEIKNILVKPARRAAGLKRLLGETMQSDEEGEACYDSLLFSKYKKMSEEKISEEIKNSWPFDNTPYLVRCEKYFKKYANDLRDNIDEQFQKHFEKMIKYLEDIGTSEENIKKFRELEDFIRRKWTREGLDLLCRKSQAVDLERVRANLQSGFVQSSYDEIKYLRKHGEWEDIPLIINLKIDLTSRSNGPTFLTTDNNWSKYVGCAINNIGKTRPDELFNLEMPFTILAEVIKQSTPSLFLEISQDTLFKLLNNEHDDIRKYVSLKIIQAMSKKQINKLLNEYLENQDYRYYNVIFWLDFGISLSKKVVKSSVNLILREAY